jgi:hypothetical protein
MYRSIDKGISWSAVNTGFPDTEYPSCLVLSPSGYIFIGTSISGVHRSMQAVTSITGDMPLFPIDIMLHQNHPNPCNPRTIISYELPELSSVTVKIYNILGKEMKTLVDEPQGPGRHEVAFDASQLASGIYFYKMTAGKYELIKKMVVVK